MNFSKWTAGLIPEVIDPLSDYGLLYFGDDKLSFKKHTVITDSNGKKYYLICAAVDNPVDAIYPLLEEGDSLEVPFQQIIDHLTDFVKSAILDQGLASALYDAFVPPEVDSP